MKWVPRLVDDARALKTLFKGDKPAKRVVRPKVGTSVSNSFGDASAFGFGSSTIIGEKLCYKSGQWDEIHTKQSSNYRELGNLIYIEEQLARGQLRDTELFIFTDHSTIVGIYLPLSRHKPWRLKGTPMLELVEVLLRELPVTCHEWGRDILWKLLKQSRKLDSLP